MSLSVGKLTKIKSRYKVVEDWQTNTDEYKIAANYYRTNYPKSSSKPMPPKIGLALFAYLYTYQSGFSKTYRGKYMKLLPRTEDDIKENKHIALNKSNANPNDYDFRGQLIRMELPLITYHTNVCWEIYFEKIPIKIPSKPDESKQKSSSAFKPNDNVLIKASVMDRNNTENDDLVRIKITNFNKFISMNMENNENNTKSLIIELKKSEIIKSEVENTETVDDKSDFETDEEEEEEDRLDSDYDDNDPRYVGLEPGDPFISGEYYFIGICSNKVEQFDTDTNNYHLDGFGIDSAQDYIYIGEGNNVIDTEELDDPWTKPPILNLDVVRVECNMQKRQLTFYKNDDEEYHCPITRKIFNKSSYIVANGKTGNVYSYDAIKQLNIKKNDFRDLIDNTPFTKKDIITIQNPQNPSRQNIENFVHIVRAQKKTDNHENEQYKIDENDNKNSNNNKKNELCINPNVVTNHAQIRHNSATKRIFAQIQKENDKQGPSKKKMKLSSMSSGDKMKKNKINDLGLYNKYTTGKMAASFTSTAMTPVFKDEFQPFTEEQIRKEKWRNVKGNGKKAYVRVVTNLGDLNFILDCDYVPKTCYNFLTHCDNGYYDNTIFHRNIMSFMIQGGDPEGTGHGGKCAWSTKNGKFEDEFNKLQKHDERGIIAMANSGPNTNGSQFYILYQPAPHLDGKHSVFGRLVGGMDVLNRMEEVPVNEDNDKPLKAIKILKTAVYQNPFNDPLPHQIKEEKEKKEQEIEKLNKQRGNWWSNTVEAVSKSSNNKTNIDDSFANKFEIGKYIKDKKLLDDRYGIGGRLRDLDTNNKSKNNKNKKKKKKKREKFVLPTPVTQNDLPNKEKHKKVTKSTFRFKDFDSKK